MCSYDGEAAETWVRGHPKARKRHRCESCGGAINTGKRYLSLFVVFDGSPSRSRFCLPCERLTDKFGDAHGFTPHPTGLSDALMDCVDEGESDAWVWKLALNKLRKRGAAHEAVRKGK